MRLVIITCILFITCLSRAQEWSLALSSSVELRTLKLTNQADRTSRPLSGANIALYQGATVVKQIQSGGNGDFTIDVPGNGDYILVVSYEGCNPKRFEISTKVPPKLNTENWKPAFSIEGVIMAKPLYSIDYSALKQPLARITYMKDSKKIDDDEDYTDKILDALQGLRTREDALIEKFITATKAGDAALKKPDCPLAKSMYEQALSLIPNEPYPIEQLTKVAVCFKDKENAEKAAAEKKAADEKAAAEKAAREKEEKLAAEKAAKEQEAAEKQKKEAAEKLATEKAASEKLQKQTAEKTAKEQEAAEKQKKEAAEKLATEKAASEKLQKQTAEKTAKEQEAAEKQKKEAAEKLAAEKAASEKLEKQAAEKATTEQEKIEKQKKAAEKEAREKEEQLAKEKELKEKETAKEQEKARVAAEELARKEAKDKEARDKEQKKVEENKKTEENKAAALKKEPEKKEPSPTKQPEEPVAKPVDNNRPQPTDEVTKGKIVSKSADDEAKMRKQKKGDSKRSVPQLLGVDQYKEFVKKGDELFKDGRYEDARSAYESALNFKASDQYATGRIAEITKILQK